MNCFKSVKNHICCTPTCSQNPRWVSLFLMTSPHLGSTVFWSSYAARARSHGFITAASKGGKTHIISRSSTICASDSPTTGSIKVKVQHPSCGRQREDRCCSSTAHKMERVVWAAPLCGDTLTQSWWQGQCPCSGFTGGNWDRTSAAGERWKGCHDVTDDGRKQCFWVVNTKRGFLRSHIHSGYL